MMKFSQQVFTVLLVFLIATHTNLAEAVSPEALGKAAKAVSEIFKAAETEQAASSVVKAEKLTQPIKAVEPAASQTSKYQILLATDKVIQECQNAQKSLVKKNNWCSSQKEKVATCIENKLNGGMLLTYASKQCQQEIIN